MKNNPGGCFGLGFLRSFLYLNQGRIAAGNFFDVCDLRQVKTVHSTSYGSTCGVDKIAMNTLKWVFIIAAATEMSNRTLKVRKAYLSFRSVKAKSIHPLDYIHGPLESHSRIP